MRPARSEGVWEELALPLRAAEGDRRALGAVVASEALATRARELKLGSGLALAARRAGLAGAGLEGCSKQLRATAAAWMLLERAAESVLTGLGGSAIACAPIKGYDVGERFYGEREERPIGDLDVLVAEEDRAAACEVLGGLGWRLSEATPRTRRFLDEEGYTCHFSGRGSPELPDVLVEIHFRLWGFVPDGLAAEMLRGAGGDGALRLRPEHAYLLAACHAWTRTPPRPLTDWRDMEGIARSIDGTEALAGLLACARHRSLQLPVCLSAEAASRLWPSSLHAGLVDALEPELRPFERRQLARLRRRGPDAVSTGGVVLARLLSSRSSRAGWRSVWRRLWAHPGVVEQQTPAGKPWAWRRWSHLWRALIE